MNHPNLALRRRLPECAMALAVLVLAFDALLVGQVVPRGTVGRTSVEPSSPIAAAARRHHADTRSPWDEDQTMGRYPDQNPFHVPGET